MNWNTRVTAQLKEAKSLLRKSNSELKWEVFGENYKGHEIEVNIHNVRQRWILVHSEHTYERELKTFYRRMNKKSGDLIKKLWHLGNETFKCESDAEKVIKPLLKALKYHTIDYQIVPIEKYAAKIRL